MVVVPWLSNTISKNSTQLYHQFTTVNFFMTYLCRTYWHFYFAVSRLTHLPTRIGSLRIIISIKRCKSPPWTEHPDSMFQDSFGFLSTHLYFGAAVEEWKANGSSGWLLPLWEKPASPHLALSPNGNHNIPLDHSYHSNPSCPHSLSANVCSVPGKVNTYLLQLW